MLVEAYRDEPIPGTVTRTSWALNVKSRTLRAEIDLPNPGGQLLPGMYAYANVIIERPGVETLPVSALISVGDRTYCWMYKEGRAERIEVQTGVSDDQWMEVTNLRRPASSSSGRPWTLVDGSEQVIMGDLSILSDGALVEVAPTSKDTKSANRSASPDARPTTRPTGRNGPLTLTPLPAADTVLFRSLVMLLAVEGPLRMLRVSAATADSAAPTP